MNVSTDTWEMSWHQTARQGCSPIVEFTWFWSHEKAQPHTAVLQPKRKTELSHPASIFPDPKANNKQLFDTGAAMKMCFHGSNLEVEPQRRPYKNSPMCFFSDFSVGDVLKTCLEIQVKKSPRCATKSAVLTQNSRMHPVFDLFVFLSTQQNSIAEGNRFHLPNEQNFFPFVSLKLVNLLAGSISYACLLTARPLFDSALWPLTK